MMFHIRSFRNICVPRKIFQGSGYKYCSALKRNALTSHTSNVFPIKRACLLPCAAKKLFVIHLSKLYADKIRAYSGRASTAETIYAVSSGHGKCGVSVIRVSGPLAAEVLQAVTGWQVLPKPRHAILTKFLNPNTGHAVDQGLLLWFPGPSSFTGEDCCEFQVHGGIAVVSAMLDAIDCVPGTRHAEPGDYTKRAFQNGKLDLTQVEGLGDLIHAETEAQRRQALRQMHGDLRDLYGGWRKRLLKCVANTEAYIDFSEDDNIEDGVLDSDIKYTTTSTGVGYGSGFELTKDTPYLALTGELWDVFFSRGVGELRQEICQHLADHRQGERLRSGVHVVILGEPNVGKSTLLNTITRRPAAIVSPIAGTTRDVVETSVNIGGYPALLSDTAGLRETQDMVEKEGVRRALDRAAAADLILLVLDATKVKVITRETLTQELWALGLHGYYEYEDTERISGVQERWEDPDLVGSLSSKQSDSTVVMDSISSRYEAKQLAFKTNNITDDIPSSITSSWSNMIVVLNKVDLLLSEDRTAINQAPSAGAKLSAVSTFADNPVTLLMSHDRCGIDSESGFSEHPAVDSSVPIAGGPKICHVSCSTGEGFESFMDIFKNKLEILCGDPSVGSPSLTQSRHRHHLQDCVAALDCYTDHINIDVVLAAHHLQHALWHIGKITGSVEPEEILDVIFRDFCIGK